MKTLRHFSKNAQAFHLKRFGVFKIRRGVFSTRRNLFQISTLPARSCQIINFMRWQEKQEVAGLLPSVF